MGKIITITTNKGGSGKTTIATNLACSLAILNKKVILIDLDGLCAINFEFGKTYNDVKNHTILDVLNENNKLENCVLKIHNNLDLLVSDPNLKEWDKLIIQNNLLESRLNQLLNWLKKQYNYVIIDTPPQMSNINYLAIKLSDLLIIPFELDQINIFSTFATLSEINNLSDCKNKFKLMIPNKVKIDNTTCDLKLNKHQNKLYEMFINTLENNDTTTIISQSKIINSSLFNQSILKYNLPVMAINSNSKIYNKIKKCFENLAFEIMNIK